MTCLAGCASHAQVKTGTPQHLTKYKIDGSFDDWKTYGTAKTTTNLDWTTFHISPEYDGIILKEFYYDNDENYLYVFFKFKPTLQERYDKTHSTGSVGCLYIDSDMNTNTGCDSDDSHGGSNI